MALQVDGLALGMLQTNCYIVGDEATLEAIIIDPSDEPEKILAKVKERGYTVKEILLTHAHFDHVLATLPVKEALQVPLRVHPDGVPQLQNAQQIAAMFNIPAPYPPAAHDAVVQHGMMIPLGAFHLEARYTPGHSPGHLIFVVVEQHFAVVGDCIFYDGIGRVDLPGGDAITLKKSIQNEILVLPDDFILYPGHGPQTTVGREKHESQALADLLSI